MERRIKAYYNKVAAEYDRRWRWYVQHTLEQFTRRLPLSGTETVLDVACGTGELQKRLLRYYPALELVGVDLCERMIEIARAKLEAHAQVSFRQATASRLPFPNGHSDPVVSANSFHYFDDPVGSLVEMRRVVKPAGPIIMMDWCRDFMTCAIFDVLSKLYDPSHSRCYTARELRTFYETAGLNVQWLETFRLGYFWGLMVASGTIPAG